MDLSEFTYELPAELIAQHPAGRRDDSRLMYVERLTGSIRHLSFRELPKLLEPEDLLVLNRTRVFPARLLTESDGKPVEVLLIREEGGGNWEALIKPGRKAPPKKRLVFKKGQFEAVVLESRENSPVRLIHLDCTGDVWEWIERLGRPPLPPYIRRRPTDELELDQERYQTVFARDRGSVAAPTAGLHFTKELLREVPHCFLTLHVGYGTFRPVSARQIEKHQMDSEFYRISSTDAGQIAGCRRKGGKVIAVGTTTTRTLEHIWRKNGKILAEEGWTDLFIYPGFKFQAIDGLITNFHLPGSTLLMLVSAFAGIELVRECYRKAVEAGYRFYSYGDAMFVR